MPGSFPDITFLTHCPTDIKFFAYKPDKTPLKFQMNESEIKNDTAYVSYRDVGRDPKVLKLVKDSNKWKVVLSFKSIF